MGRQVDLLPWLMSQPTWVVAVVAAAVASAVLAVPIIGYLLGRQGRSLGTELESVAWEIPDSTTASDASVERDVHPVTARGRSWRIGLLGTRYTVKEADGRVSVHTRWNRFVALLGTPGAPPWRITNLSDWPAAERLASWLAAGLHALQDDRMVFAHPEQEASAEDDAQAMDRLQVLDVLLTAPRDELPAALAALAPEAWAERAEVLLRLFPGHPQAVAVAQAALRDTDPMLRGLAALALDTPEALQAVILDPQVERGLRLRAASARGRFAWSADDLHALLAALAEGHPEVLDRVAAQMTDARPAAEAALLALAEEDLRPGWAHLLGALGGPASLPLLGGWAYGDDRPPEARRAARAALDRVQGRLPSGQAGQLAVATDGVGGLSEVVDGGDG